MNLALQAYALFSIFNFSKDSLHIILTITLFLVAHGQAAASFGLFLMYENWPSDTCTIFLILLSHELLIPIMPGKNYMPAIIVL